MLREPGEVKEGQTVYLYPQTKQASANVHRMLAVTILRKPTDFWPYLVVGWSERGTSFWEKVHRDNIRLRSRAATTTKAEKTAGDSIGDKARGGTARVRVMPGKKKVEPTDGQEALF
jgi:hypothetical protein